MRSRFSDFKFDLWLGSQFGKGSDTTRRGSSDMTSRVRRSVNRPTRSSRTRSRSRRSSNGHWSEPRALRRIACASHSRSGTSITSGRTCRKTERRATRCGSPRRKLRNCVWPHLGAAGRRSRARRRGQQGDPQGPAISRRHRSDSQSIWSSGVSPPATHQLVVDQMLRDKYAARSRACLPMRRMPSCGAGSLDQGTDLASSSSAPPRHS